MSEVHPELRGYIRLADPATLPKGSRWVYKIWCTDGAPQRAIAASRVLYIGQGDHDRIRALWNDNHPALGRLEEHNTIRGNQLPSRPPLSVEHWVKESGAGGPKGTPHLSELEEARLLNDFYRQHGELPLLNRKSEGWLAAKVLTALARPLLEVPGSVAAVDWVGMSAVLCPAAQPLDLWFCLVWVWPASWRSEPVVDPATGEDLRGHLLLLRHKEGGAPLPDALSSDQWWKATTLWARTPANCLAGESARLAGASAGATADAFQRLWNLLAPNETTPRSLDELQASMERARTHLIRASDR